MSLTLLAEFQQNKENKIKERETLKQWLIGDGEYTHEVTLTFPFNPKHTEICEKIYGVFKNRLAERCYKKMQQQDIEMAVVLEGEISNKRLHYHCAMRCPKHMTDDYFARRIAKTWCDVVNNKYARVVIKKYTNDRWIGYMTKEFSSSNTIVVSEHTNF